MKHSTPIEILENLADIGVSKTNCTLRKLILMGIMAGAYIAFAEWLLLWEPSIF